MELIWLGAEPSAPCNVEVVRAQERLAAGKLPRFGAAVAAGGLQQLQLFWLWAVGGAGGRQDFFWAARGRPEQQPTSASGDGTRESFNPVYFNGT